MRARAISSTASSRPAWSGFRGRSRTGRRERHRRASEPRGRASLRPRPAAGGSSAFASASTGAHGAGQGDEVAGTRPYRPGDRPTWIDWPASARLSAARGTDEFVVREFFADTAPLVALAVDRRPRMELYGPPLPWLDKPAATAAAIASIGRASGCRRRRARLRRPARRPTALALAGPPLTVLERVEAHERGRRGGRRAAVARRLPPRAHPARVELSRRNVRFRRLRFHRRRLPRTSGSSCARSAGTSRPSSIQDPTWEQSFPAVGGVLLPVRDATSGDVGEVLISGREARERARANEHRLESMLGGFARLGFDPVVLGSSDPAAIAEGFDRWASRRRRLRRRSA